MTTQKLDFDLDNLYLNTFELDPIKTTDKLKQFCQAVDVINEKVQSLFDLYHKNFDEKGVIYGNIESLEKRIKDLEGRQRIAETLVALEDNSLLNKVGELSMKINKMQSDLREFEKQKVDPLRERLDKLEKITSKKPELSYSPNGVKFYFDNLLSSINERLDNIKNRVDGLDARLPHPLIGNLDKVLDKIGKKQCEQHHIDCYAHTGGLCNCYPVKKQCDHDWKLWNVAGYKVEYKCQKCGAIE